jgi:hypothetical protein
LHALNLAQNSAHLREDVARQQAADSTAAVLNTVM